MGMIYGGVLERLALFLKDRFDLRTFVETGTAEGNSAVWAARHFRQVHTIEAGELLWQAACERHAHCANVNFILG